MVAGCWMATAPSLQEVSSTTALAGLTSVTSTSKDCSWLAAPVVPSFEAAVASLQVIEYCCAPPPAPPPVKYGMVMAMSTTPKSAAVTMAGRSMSAREDINGLQVEQPTGDRMKGVWVDVLERPVSSGCCASRQPSAARS